jgi:hypothetical protein
MNCLVLSPNRFYYQRFREPLRPTTAVVATTAPALSCALRRLRAAVVAPKPRFRKARRGIGRIKRPLLYRLSYTLNVFIHRHAVRVIHDFCVNYKRIRLANLPMSIPPT